MKKLLFLTLPIICLAFIKADWITVKIDEKVSIDFPSAPDTMEANGTHIWSNMKEDGFKCMVVVLDFANFGLDSAGLAAQMEGESFFEDFKTSMLAQMKGASLLTEEVTKVKGWPAYKMVIDLGATTDKISKAYCTNMFVGQRLYSLFFYENPAKPEEIKKNKFFDSFRVK
jgi:hypothetical protein